MAVLCCLMVARASWLVVLLWMVAGYSAQAQEGASFQWLVGTWKTLGANPIAERWTKVNDSTYTGVSWAVRATGDSLMQETIQLRARQGQWSYEPLAFGQNNNQPVVFKIIFIGRQEFIAENPAHDFPQRIAYRRIDDRLFASIEGKRKERYLKRNFDYQKK